MVDIQVEKISEIDAKMLAMTFLDLALKFYQDPKNVAAFNEWQKKRRAKEKALAGA